jgi:hypothetical protein
MGAEPNSRLSVVGDHDDAEPTSPSRPVLSDDRQETGRRPWEGRVGIGVLVFLLAAASFLAALEYRRAESLAELNGSLRGELSVVRGQLSAYRAHLADVRLGVTDLSARFDQLRGLVHREPVPSQAQGDPGSPGQALGAPSQGAANSQAEPSADPGRFLE